MGCKGITFCDIFNRNFHIFAMDGTLGLKYDVMLANTYIEEAYRIFEDKSDGVIKVAVMNA